MLKNNFIARYYALWKVKVLENVFSAIICSFAVNNWSNLWRYWNQMFALFPAAIFVLLRGAQIWCPHSEPYKFLLPILTNNSAAENCINVRLVQVVNLYQHSIISESFGFRHSTVLILVFDGTKPPIIWFQSIQAKQVGVTVRPHWSSLRLLLRIYERSPCSKSTIRGNLPQVCPSVPSYLILFLWFRRIFFLLSFFKRFWFLSCCCCFFSRTRISQFITGSIYTVFTCGVVLWVKWKAMESLILLFIPWCRPSSEQLSKLTHAPTELFKEAEHSFTWNSLSLYGVC